MDFKQTALDIVSEISGKDAGELLPEMELVGDLNIDSPKALQLLVDLEDKLSIEISDEAAAKLDTVGDILDYLATVA